MKNQRLVISIVGFGNVGRSILSQLLNHQNTSFYINIIELEEAGYGSFLDLSHASMFNKQHHLVWNSKELLQESNYIFHCAGANIPLNSNRLSVANESIRITQSIFKNFRTNVTPIIIVIANPVDVISYLTYKLTGLHSSQVVGTGTFLDSIRMNYYIQQIRKDYTADINTSLIGEHGDSIVFQLAQTFINGQPICDVLTKEEINFCLDKMKNSAKTIKSTQGSTYYGVAACGIEILKEIINPSGKTLALSALLSVEQQQLFECEPLFMSVPAKITTKGLFPEKDIKYSDKVLAALKNSAQIISDHINF